MHVGIDETGAQQPAANVYDLVGLVFAKAYHLPLVDRDVCFVDLAREHIDQLCIPENEIGRFFSPRDRDQGFQSHDSLSEFLAAERARADL
jgi:hypothetical protein